MKKFFYLFIFAFAALCILINLYANRFIFYPKKDYLVHLVPAEEVMFASADGTQLHGLYLPPAPYMDTILFFHGNAGNVTYFEDFAEIYAKQGYGVFMFDYRGFGRSEGSLTQANVYRDSKAAVNYLLKAKNTPPSNIILWGFSFGNAPAVETALMFKDTPFKALVMQSPFTNIPQMAAALIGGGYAPQNGLQKFLEGFFNIVLFDKHYDNLAKIQDLKLPLLIGCSKQDSLIPWQMSAALAHAAPAGTASYVSETGHHTSFAWFEKEAIAFINKQK